MKLLRIYTDTSVLGGCLDIEFQEYSERFIKQARKGFFKLVVSDIVIRELVQAPDYVRTILDSIPLSFQELVEENEEAIELRDAYLNAGILTPKSKDDATHVALATICRADAIVSWNFKHIVKLDKMRMFNQVNLLNGYAPLTIVSPREVLFDAQEN